MKAYLGTMSVSATVLCLCFTACIRLADYEDAQPFSYEPDTFGTASGGASSATTSCTAFSCGTGNHCLTDPATGQKKCQASSFCYTFADCPSATACVNSVCQAKKGCQSNADCFPYECNQAVCTSRCTTNSDCHPDAACRGGECVDQACSTPVAPNCSPFACDLVTRHCFRTCDFAGSTAHAPQCAAGYDCGFSLGKADPFICLPECTASEQAQCQGYLCDTGFGTCRDDCSTLYDCHAGYLCRNQKCVKAACTADADCRGFRCASGECSQVCTTSADCAQGAQCIATKCVL